MLEQPMPSEASDEEWATIEAGRPAQRTRRGWLSALVAGVALVAVVAVFGAVALGRQDGALAMIGWQAYRDPLGLYSIRIPASWKASAATNGAFTIGDRTGSFSGKSEDIMFSDPAQGGGSARIMIQADQINSAFGRQWYCEQWRSEETSNFNGYPAMVLDPGVSWRSESYNAHFQIGVEIPGALAPDYLGGRYPYPPLPTPTPLPQTMVKADQTIIATALGSFQPAEKPLTCG